MHSDIDLAIDHCNIKGFGENTGDSKFVKGFVEKDPNAPTMPGDPNRVLAVTCPPTGTVGGTAYAKCGPNWWTYDTPTTLAAKARWAKSQGLGGTAFWELSMDTADGQLVSALHANR